MTATATATVTRVRYKRCPLCGTVVLMSMAICPICDRHFQTTAGLAHKTTMNAAPWTTGSPYSYASSGQVDFAVIKPQTFVRHETTGMSYGPVIAAAIGLPSLGMILNHQFAKGMAVLGLSVALAVLGYVYGLSSPLMLLVTVLAAVAGYVIGLLDVISIAQRFGRGEDVREWDWF